MGRKTTRHDTETLQLFPELAGMAPLSRERAAAGFPKGLKQSTLDAFLLDAETFDGKYFEPEDEKFGADERYGVPKKSAWEGKLPRNVSIRKARILEYIYTLSELQPPDLPSQKSYLFTIGQLAHELMQSQAEQLELIVAAGNEARYRGGNITGAWQHRSAVYDQVQRDALAQFQVLVQRVYELQADAEKHSRPRALAKAFEADGHGCEALKAFPHLRNFANVAVYFEHRRAFLRELRAIKKKYANYTDREFQPFADQFMLDVHDAVKRYEERGGDLKENRIVWDEVMNFDLNPDRSSRFEALMTVIAQPIAGFDKHFRENLRLAYKLDRLDIRKEQRFYHEQGMIPERDDLANTSHTLDILYYARWTDAADMVGKFMDRYAKTMSNPRHQAKDAREEWLKKHLRKQELAAQRKLRPPSPSLEDRWRDVIKNTFGPNGMEI